KFSKDGKFVFSDDGSEVSEEEDFVALADETLVGWIRFNEDAPPDRAMGLLYQGFIPPRRETLGDTDETQWEPDLSCRPADPWRNQMCLVLQNVATREMATFVTTSVSGRRAVGNLLRHFDRVQRGNKNDYPIVRLASNTAIRASGSWRRRPSPLSARPRVPTAQSPTRRCPRT